MYNLGVFLHMFLENINMSSVLDLNKKELNSMCVYNANALVDSIHHQKFTETELKVMYWVFIQVKKEDIQLFFDEKVKKIIIQASDLAINLGYENKKSFNHLKKLVHTIQSKTMSSRIDKGFIRMVIIPTFKYEDGVITLELNHNVLPYLIELKTNYTQFYFINILKLTSSYAIKFYTLLKQYQSAGRRIITIVDLKMYFAIEENEYEMYKDFRSRVVDISIKQINACTDLFIQYREIKTSRKITAIEFIIKDKNDVEDEQIRIKYVSNAEINEALNFFIKLAEFDKTLGRKIIKYIKEKDYSYVIKAMLYTFTKTPKSPQAYLSIALQKGYGQDIAIGELEHFTYKKIDRLGI